MYCTLINSHVPSSILMYQNVLSCMGMYSLSCTPNNSQVPKCTLVYPHQLSCTLLNYYVPKCTLMYGDVQYSHVPQQLSGTLHQLSCTLVNSPVPKCTHVYHHQHSSTLINSRHQLSPSTPLCSPHLLLSFDWENQFESNFHTNSCLSALHQLHSH